MRTGILIGLAAAAGVGVTRLLDRPEKIETRANLSGLRAQLEAAAERSLTLPSLAMPSTTIKTPSTELDSRTTAVIRLAEGFGGSARRGLDRDAATVVLATLPEDRVEAFFEAAQSGKSVQVSEKSPAAEMVDCEVLLKTE